MAASVPSKPYQRPGFWARLTSGNPTEAQLGYLLLVPAFLSFGARDVLSDCQRGVEIAALRKAQLAHTGGRHLRGLENFREMGVGVKGLTWTVTHLLVWRSLLLAALVAAWVFVWRRFSWTALGWTALLVSVCGRCSGFNRGRKAAGTTPAFYNAFGVSLLIIFVSVRRLVSW